MSKKSTKSKGIEIRNFKTTDITPKLPGIAGKKLPTVLRPLRCEYELVGVNKAIANAIRRVVLSETKALALQLSTEDFKTNDPFIKLEDFIKERIACIPILQSIDPDAEFKLDFINDSRTQVSIFTRDLIQTKGKKGKYFDEATEILSIAPGKYVQMNSITVTSGYEYEFGGFTLAHGSTLTPLDEIPYDMYTKKGVSSSVSVGKHHKMTFETNGTIDPKDLIIKACDEIKTRLNLVEDQLYQLNPVGNEHHLLLRGENVTIGNIIENLVSELYEDNVDCICPDDVINKYIKIIIRADEANNVISAVIKHANEVLTEIKILMGRFASH